MTATITGTDRTDLVPRPRLAWRRAAAAAIIAVFAVLAGGCGRAPQPARMHGSAEIVDPLDDSHAGNGTPELQRDVDAERNRSLIAELRGRGVSVESSSRGVVVTIPDAFFGLDGDVLTQDAVFIVADLAGVLRSSAANGRRIAVEGHTDSVGSEEVNRSRSHRRARTVADALVSRGIARDILFVRGLGETLPVEPNVYPDGFDNPRGRARNRRVEIVVLNPQQR